MRIETPRPKCRQDDDYGVFVSKGYGDPHGTIALDEAWELTLDAVRPEDCDRLIKAAAEIKSKVLAYQAELVGPHGTKYLHKGRCQLCGKPEADELHAEPAAARGDRDEAAQCPDCGTEWDSEHGAGCTRGPVTVPAMPVIGDEAATAVTQ